MSDANALFVRLALIWFFFNTQACTGYNSERQQGDGQFCDSATISNITDKGQVKMQADNLDSIGDRRMLTGQFGIASVCYNHAFEIREKTSGKLDVSLADSLYRMATVEEIRQNYDNAVAYYRRGLKILERQALPNRQKVKMFQCYLAAIRFYNGFGDSLNGVQHALTMYQRIYIPGNVFIGAVSHRLANLYFDGSNYEESEGYYEQAVRIVLQYCGEYHPYTAILLADYTELLKRENREVLVIQTERRIEAIRKRFPEKEYTKIYQYK